MCDGLPVSSASQPAGLGHMSLEVGLSPLRPEPSSLIFDMSKVIRLRCVSCFGPVFAILRLMDQLEESTRLESAVTRIVSHYSGIGATPANSGELEQNVIRL